MELFHFQIVGKVFFFPFVVLIHAVDLFAYRYSLSVYVKIPLFSFTAHGVPPFRFVGWFADESKRGGDRHPGPPASGTLSNGKFL